MLSKAQRKLTKFFYYYQGSWWNFSFNNFIWNFQNHSNAVRYFVKTCLVPNGVKRGYYMCLQTNKWIFNIFFWFKNDWFMLRYKGQKLKGEDDGSNSPGGIQRWSQRRRSLGHFIFEDLSSKVYGRKLWKVLSFYTMLSLRCDRKTKKNRR